MSKSKKTPSAKPTTAPKAEAAPPPAPTASEKLRKQAIAETQARIDGKPVPAAKTKAKKATKGAKTAKAKHTSGLDAAHKVLVNAGKPMRVREIADTAIKGGLWASNGATPHQTLAAAIGREIAAKGKAARFRRAERGLFAANKEGK